MCHEASAALRAIVVRQRNRQRFLYRHLKAKGVSSKANASCASWKRTLCEVKPPGDDARLPTTLVRQQGGLAESPVTRPQPSAGLGPARAEILPSQSNEPYT